MIAEETWLYDDGPNALEQAWLVFSQTITPVEIDTETGHHETMVEWWNRTIGEPNWSKQIEIMDAVDRNRFTSVASGVGLGKSEIMARIAVAFLNTRPNSIVLTTAPTDLLVKTILWSYIRRIYNTYQPKLLGKAITKQIQISPDWYALGFKASDHETDRFRGFHARSGNILTIVDEAQGVSDGVIDVLRNTMTAENARFVMIGNPTSLNGRFRESFHEKRDNYRTINISAYDSPNFPRKDGTLESDTPDLRFLKHALTTPAFVEDMINEHGIESDYVRSNVRAEWAKGTLNTLISLVDLEFTEKQAGELYSENVKYYAGVDVARFGDDESAVSVRYGREEIAFAAWKGLDTTETADRVAKILTDLERRGYDGAKRAEIRVDTIGVGGGVKDALKHAGYRARDVNVGEASSDKAQWRNLRHELWWQLRTLFIEHLIAPAEERYDYTKDITRPQRISKWDTRMVAQLSNVLYSYAVGYEKPEIEAKDKMKKRTGYSPDRAEALLLSYGQLPRKGIPGVVAQSHVRTRR